MQQEKIERERVRGKTIYRVTIDSNGIEARKETHPLGLGYGNYVADVYTVSLEGETQHYTVHDGWAYMGSLTGCFVHGKGFVDEKRAAEFLGEVKQLLSVEDKENVIKAYAKVKKIVEESFADIEPSI